jgi:hypothetical protein
MRFLRFLSFSRIARTLFACEAAPQPLMPDVSIFQSFSVLPSTFAGWLWSEPGRHGERERGEQHAAVLRIVFS